MNHASATHVRGGLGAGIEAVRKNWGFFLVSGIVFVVLGGLALVYSMLTTLASVFVFGCALVIGGIFQIIHAFKASQWSGILLELLAGVLYIVVGLLMATRPLAGALSLTLLLAVLFLAIGAFRIAATAILRPPRWGWLLLSGIITFLLGVLVAAALPESGLWVIGTFVGIDMIFNGVWLIMLAFGTRTLPVFSLP
jgi:uncharacterized membrane protein HdeD (DUF308 family)